MNGLKPALVMETKRLILRPYTAQDATDVWRVAQKEQIYATTAGIPRDYSRMRAEWWIRFVNAAIGRHSGYELAITEKESGRYLGNVGLVNVRKEQKSATVAYYIDPDFWNCGFATEACQRMVQFGFEELGLERIGGSCMKENMASRRVMEHLGFVFEGVARRELYKDGKFYDIVHLSLLREEWLALQ